MGFPSLTRITEWQRRPCIILTPILMLGLPFGAFLIPYFWAGSSSHLWYATSLLQSIGSKNPAVPRNSLTCLTFFGVGIFNTVSLHASESHLWPPFRMYPKYITWDLQIWAFLAEALYPEDPNACSKFSVPFLQAFSSTATTSRSSTYCRRLTSGFLSLYPWKSSCKASSKKAAEFLNP